MTGGALQKEVVASQPSVISGVEKGVSSVEVTRETDQVPGGIKGAEPGWALSSSIVKDPKATQTSVPKDPTSEQTPSLARTMIAEQYPGLIKESVGATTSST